MNQYFRFGRADWFYFGVLIHNIGLLLFWSQHIQVFKFLLYAGPIFFIYGLFVNRKNLSTQYKPYIYKILLVISLLMWLRFDINGANGGTLQDINGAFSMSFFLLLFYDPKIFRLRDIKKWVAIAAVCGVLFAIYSWQYILAANAYQGSYSNNEGAVTMAMAAIYILMGCGFILCVHQYYSKRFVLFSLFIMVFTIIIAMTSGRRGYTVVNLMFVAQYICFIVIYAKGVKRISVIIFVLIFLSSCYLYYEAFKDTQLSMFFLRLDTDSRSDVFWYWDKEMSKNIWYWVWGKGVSGGYWDGSFGMLRPGIENGMRHMILKGGLIYFLSYCVLSLRMAYLGWFKSNNRLTKGVAIYIIILFIFIFVWGTPSFSYTHLFMWMGYVWIGDRQIRNMNNKDVYVYLN